MMKKEEYDAYHEEFSDEYSKIPDFRLRVLFIHLNIEFYLNKLIELHFHEPKYIHKNIYLRAFKSKADLLRAIGIIGKMDYDQIILVNRIRNHYTHNIVKRGILPDEIKSRIIELINASNYSKDERFIKLASCELFDIYHQFDAVCGYLAGRLSGQCIACDEMHEKLKHFHVHHKN